nr:phosphoenolpyruvate carboxykinase [Cucumibacter marinus]
MTSISNKQLGEQIGRNAGSFYANDIAARLVYFSIQRGETEFTAHGAVVATTGEHTGRSAKDKFIVDDENTHDKVWWDNAKAMTPADFDTLLADMTEFLKGEDIFLQQLYAGADTEHRFNVEVYSPSAWHALFIRNLLIRPERGDLAGFEPNVTIVHAPGFKADPARHNTRTETVIACDFTRNIVLIGGTAYAGEIKKSVFSLFNYHAPAKDVFPMHCSANTSATGETALFFGLSGTGKTTLSTDPARALIGDDEHGWSERGIFNIEGGCYAKTVKLSREAEPEIFGATEKFATILENVIIDKDTAIPDFDDVSLTENTRTAYPLTALENVSESGVGAPPKTVIFLTADAFGVMPPIAKLTPEQAIYHFLSGYTAKVAGTERGVTEPQATFSACFGAPFMALHPTVYGEMLKKRLEESGADCWLLNTGWTGGAYGVGKRISISTSRRLLTAAINGSLRSAPMRTDPFFGFTVPVEMETVRADILDPRSRWSDKDAYDAQARMLVNLFIENFAKFGEVAQDLAEAGPKASSAA